MITWEQRNQWLGQMRARITAKVAGVQPRAGYGVVVQGGVISLDPVSRPTPPARRAWSYVIFARVTMTQNYSTSEPGQVNGVFEYEPRYVGALQTPSAGDYLPGLSGLPMLPTIISADPHPDEAFPGVVFQQDLISPEPSTLDKFATVTLYLRGWWDDSPEPVPVFADAFPVGRMRLTTRQTQSVIAGEPPDIVTLTEEAEVTATYAGASLMFTAFPTAPNAPGDSTATIAITAARKP